MGHPVWSKMIPVSLWVQLSPLGDGGELLALAVGDVVDDVGEAAEVAEGAADLHGVRAHAVEQVVHRVAPRRALSDEACCEGVFGYYVFGFQQFWSKFEGLNLIPNFS